MFVASFVMLASVARASDGRLAARAAVSAPAAAGTPPPGAKLKANAASNGMSCEDRVMGALQAERRRCGAVAGVKDKVARAPSRAPREGFSVAGRGVVARVAGSAGPRPGSGQAGQGQVRPPPQPRGG